MARANMGLLWTLHGPDDLHMVEYTELPSYEAGDAQFFVEQGPGPWVQLRPVLDAERLPHRPYIPADRLLVCRRPGEIELRALVRLKLGYRDNTPRGVRRAIMELRKTHPDIAAQMRQALEQSARA